MPAPSPVDLAEAHQYQALFITRLHWGAPDHQPVTVVNDDGVRHTVTNVSSYAGIRVWVCPERPGAKVEVQIDRALAKVSTDRIVIFHDDDEQVWRWPVRRQVGESVTSRLTSHRHRSGQPNPKFAARLATITLPTDKLLDANTVVAKVRAAFDVETQNETRQASRLMARMYAAMEKAYPPATPPAARDHDISLTLARLLFLMFGDDTEMWTPDAFRDFIHTRTSTHGADMSAQLDLLFTHLNTAAPTLAPESPVGFKYVNGGIFAEHISLPTLDKEFRDVVLEACAVDWSTISPAIFGSMFQSVRDAETRRKLGEHYTSETNILKTLNPLFLDELRADYAAAVARDTMTKQVNGLNALWKRLGDLRFMDPACGCGNFIIVAYRELRDIEQTVMEALLDRQQGGAQLTLGGDFVRALRVTLDHFHGIEIDEWPARIAETAMYLIDRQCDLKLRDRFGQAPERLPIQTQARIVVGNALSVPWDEVCAPSANVVIAGNPPFHGHKERGPGGGRDLRAAWGRKAIGHLDYVTGWYARALQYFGTLDGRWAFVSTNSLVQGESVPALFGEVYRAGWRIAFAHRTFKWQSEAPGSAGVSCVIVGFTRSSKAPARLFDYPTSTGPWIETDSANINAYLVDAPDVLVQPSRASLCPDLPPIKAGSTPIDWKQLTDVDVDVVQADPVAAKYLRRYVGGKELIHGIVRHCLWMDTVDFDPADLIRSPLLAAAVQKVTAERLSSDRPQTKSLAATPHLFGEIRQPHAAYLGIPQTFSENRPYATAARLPQDTIASVKLFTAEDPDGLAFAIISSALFLVWQKTIGGRLESRPSFSSSVVWNTLPLRALTSTRREQLTQAGQAVEQARQQYPAATLADLYKPGDMPAGLLEAHTRLDTVADSLLGLTGSVSERDRQRALLKSYASLTQKNRSVSR